MLSGGLLDTATVVQVEMPFFGVYNSGAPTFADYVAFFDRRGFLPFDVTEVHRHLRIAFQVDFAFVRKNSSLCIWYQRQIAGLGAAGRS